VERLRVGVGVAADGRVPDVPDPEIAAQAAHAVLVEDLDHEAEPLPDVEAIRERGHPRRVLPAVLDREEAILARLEHEALNAKSDSARIRALELLGKAAGLFTEKIEIEQVERSAEAIERDIRQRLQRLGLVKAE
jgi:hypothetical protein